MAKGGFWMVRSGIGRQIQPGVLERLIKDFYESQRGVEPEEPQCQHLTIITQGYRRFCADCQQELASAKRPASHGVADAIKVSEASEANESSSPRVEA
jgi:hypothetical protein